jgi:citrate synthase
VNERASQSPSDWWATGIVDMQPGVIRFRGYAVEDLIGRIGFPEMIWLMTRGELPDPRAARLLEAALVAGVDHGPQAPSIAIARMAITCGVGVNNAMASAINALGDVHGGAGEQCVAFYRAIVARLDAGRGRPGGAAPDDVSSSAPKDGTDTGSAPTAAATAGPADASPADAAALKAAVEAEIDAQRAAGVTHLPGFGHRFHPVDPRAAPLLALVDEAAAAGVVSGRFAAIGRMVEDVLAARRGGRPVPMNIDGATAVIFAELGFEPMLCRGLFILSRAVGTLAHAVEESGSGQRNKGPIPRHLVPTYTGPAPRSLPGDPEPG